MQNFNLNPGGFIGALAALALVIGIALVMFDAENAGRRIGTIGVSAVVGGALGGNYLWDRFVAKKD